MPDEFQAIKQFFFLKFKHYIMKQFKLFLFFFYINLLQKNLKNACKPDESSSQSRAVWCFQLHVTSIGMLLLPFIDSNEV